MFKRRKEKIEESEILKKLKAFEVKLESLEVDVLTMKKNIRKKVFKEELEKADSNTSPYDKVLLPDNR